MLILEFNSSTEFLDKILEEYKDGNIKVICPKCHEDMIVILTREKVREHQRCEGMYCPHGHVQMVLNMK
jgi:ssDNA-binding Zn-finger/Zn-ribbon topoisomerase 1